MDGVRSRLIFIVNFFVVFNWFCWLVLNFVLVFFIVVGNFFFIVVGFFRGGRIFNVSDCMGVVLKYEFGDRFL